MKATSKLNLGIILIVLGFGALWFGLFGVVEVISPESISDEVFEQRARDRGWVPVKDAIGEPGE